jgi:hypothetical protein
LEANRKYPNGIVETIYPILFRGCNIKELDIDLSCNDNIHFESDFVRAYHYTKTNERAVTIFEDDSNVCIIIYCDKILRLLGYILPYHVDRNQITWIPYNNKLTHKNAEYFWVYICSTQFLPTIREIKNNGKQRNYVVHNKQFNKYILILLEIGSLNTKLTGIYYVVIAKLFFLLKLKNIEP